MFLPQSLRSLHHPFHMITQPHPVVYLPPCMASCFISQKSKYFGSSGYRHISVTHDCHLMIMKVLSVWHSGRYTVDWLTRTTCSKFLQDDPLLR